MDETQQYLRKVQLVVSGQNGSGLDLSNLRIKFNVKRSDTATPNTADIRIYNLAPETALQIRNEFTHVLLQAGYEGNFGVIFQGNIKQTIIGRESATDTFLDILAGDGDKAYNFAVVNQTLQNPTQLDQISLAIQSMNFGGVTGGYIGVQTTPTLPRGKTFFGSTRDYLRVIGQSTDSTWSIQNEKLIFVKRTAYAPGTEVLLTPTTGMIGTPQQTNYGVNVKCLLNPNIQVAGRIKLEVASILQQKLNLDQIAAAKGNVSLVNNAIPRGLNPDGSYYVLVLEHIGDTRGVEWYCNLVCLDINVTANPILSVTGAN